MKNQNLIEELKKLILDENKSLTCQEVIAISQELDNFIVKEMEKLNITRVKAINKKRFLKFRSKRDRV